MRKGTWALALLCAVLLLSGCSDDVHEAVYDNDAAIAGGDRCAVLVYVGTQGEDGGYRVRAKSQTGSQTIWRYAAQEDGEEITVSCSLTVDNDARAKIVLVRPDGSVDTLAEVTKAEESASAEYTFAADAGSYKIKIVAAGQAGYQCEVRASTGGYGSA